MKLVLKNKQEIEIAGMNNSFSFEKFKDGKGNEAIFSLNRPHTGVYIPKMVWKDMYDFSEDSVLLVLASEHYDPNEYIRDYDQFVRIIQESEEKMEKKNESFNSNTGLL